MAIAGLWSEDKDTGLSFAMLTTVGPDGSLRSRPMATLKTDFDGDLWFFTASPSGKVAELHADNRVNVSYSLPNEHRFVSVAGHAELVRDAAKIRSLWNPLYKAWFPEGPDDPSIALIRVSVEQVEYWDSPSGMMVTLFGLAKAVLTGKRYEGEISEHGTVAVRHQKV